MEGPKEEGIRNHHHLASSSSALEHRMGTFFPPRFGNPASSSSRLSESSSGHSEVDEVDDEYSNIPSESLRSSTGASSSASSMSRSRKKKSNVKYKDHCDNCLTADTPQWRKGRRGETFCQDCGRSERRHDYARLRKRRHKAIAKVLKDVLENSTFISTWDDSPPAEPTPDKSGLRDESTTTPADSSAIQSTPTDPSTPQVPKDTVNGTVTSEPSRLVVSPAALTEQVENASKWTIPASRDEQTIKSVAGTAATESGSGMFVKTNETVRENSPQGTAKPDDRVNRKKVIETEMSEVAGHTKKGHEGNVKRDGAEAAESSRVRARKRSKDEREALKDAAPVNLTMPNIFLPMLQESPRLDPEQMKKIPNDSNKKRKKASAGGE